MILSEHDIDSAPSDLIGFISWLTGLAGKRPTYLQIARMRAVINDLRNKKSAGTLVLVKRPARDDSPEHFTVDIMKSTEARLFLEIGITALNVTFLSISDYKRMRIARNPKSAPLYKISTKPLEEIHAKDRENKKRRIEQQYGDRNYPKSLHEVLRAMESGRARPTHSVVRAWEVVKRCDPFVEKYLRSVENDREKVAELFQEIKITQINSISQYRAAKDKMDFELAKEMLVLKDTAEAAAYLSKRTWRQKAQLAEADFSSLDDNEFGDTPKNEEPNIFHDEKTGI